MVIKQKKVINLSKLKTIKPGTKIRVAATYLDNKLNRLHILGFSKNLEIGERVLPSVIGPATRKNAEGYYIIHKDRKKEKHSRMIEWTYNQWAGRGETTEVTDSTSIEYERYPRTIIPPVSIEFVIVEKDCSKIVVSPVFELNEANKNRILMAINVLLEAFGECEILNINNNPIFMPQVTRLNWEILPEGKYPWKIQKNRLEPFFEKAKGTNRQVIEKRQEQINKYNPDFTAVGTGGFGGYVIHGFIDKDLYVLESIQVNNATYVLRGDWESISQLSKAEILNNKLHEARIIHNKQWYFEVAKLLA